MTEEMLFELAFHTPEHERAALLDRECVGKPELRARVEALLRADAGPALWLDSPRHLDAEQTRAHPTASVSAGTLIAEK
jgi:hypothetical protein